jgi:hypothetical protein
MQPEVSAVVRSKHGVAVVLLQPRERLFQRCIRFRAESAYLKRVAGAANLRHRRLATITKPLAKTVF